MFGIGMPELLIILAVALIIIGPKKLPELAKTLGRTLGEFKRATNDLKESINMDSGLDDLGQEFKLDDHDIKESTAFTDEAPPSEEDPSAESETPDEPLSQVKEAFDEMNESDDTAGDEDRPDDDAPTQEK